MRNRFPHANHIVRVAAVFLAGFLVFLVARSILIPADFGIHGFYRAGAIDDARAWPIAYAGTASCVGCHVGKYEHENTDLPVPVDLVKDNRHSVLRCESCHGPLGRHAANQILKEKASKEETPAGTVAEEIPDVKVPLVAADALCFGCHRQITGRPVSQPQVVAVDHGGADKCESCHRPHRPRTDEDEE